MSRGERAGLGNYLFSVERASPVLENWRDSQRRVQAVNVPVTRADAAGNDGPDICRRLLATVAEHRLSIVSLPEEVGYFFIAILSPVVLVSNLTYSDAQMSVHLLGRLGSRDLFVLAIGTSLDPFEAGLQRLGEAKRTRNTLLEVVQSRPKDAPVSRHARGIPLEQTLVAIPLIREVVGWYHAHAFKVE